MKRFGIILLIAGFMAMSCLALAEEDEGKGSAKDPVAEKQALAKAVKISMADALAIASGKATGTVMGMELEKENGKIIYSFEFLPTTDSKSITEVNVDAVTGKVVEVGNESIASEAKEEAAGENKEKAEKKDLEKSLKIKVAVDKLPKAVVATAQKEVADGKITAASTMKRAYHVEVKAGDKTTKLLITADGKLIKKAGGEDEEKEEKAKAGNKEKDEDKD